MLTRNEKKLQKAKARLNDSRRLLKKYEDKYAAGRLSDRQFAKWTRYWTGIIEVGEARVAKYEARVAEETAADKAMEDQARKEVDAANVRIKKKAKADMFDDDEYRQDENENIVPINKEGQELIDLATALYDDGKITDDIFAYCKDAAQGKAEYCYTGDKEGYIRLAIQKLNERYPQTS